MEDYSKESSEFKDGYKRAIDDVVTSMCLNCKSNPCFKNTIQGCNEYNKLMELRGSIK